MGALRESLNEERTGTDTEIILPRSEGHNRVEVMRFEEATRERTARGAGPERQINATMLCIFIT
jgi:hypothetical protein